MVTRAPVAQRGATHAEVPFRGPELSARGAGYCYKPTDLPSQGGHSASILLPDTTYTQPLVKDNTPPQFVPSPERTNGSHRPIPPFARISVMFIWPNGKGGRGRPPTRATPRVTASRDLSIPNAAAVSLHGGFPSSCVGLRGVQSFRRRRQCPAQRCLIQWVL